MTQPALRREILLTALVSAFPIELAETASATPLNPEQTIIRLPGQLQWKSNPAYSEPSVDNCLLVGDGFMSAPTTTPPIASALSSQEHGGATAEQISIRAPAFQCLRAASSTRSPEHRIMTAWSAAMVILPSSPFAAAP